MKVVESQAEVPKALAVALKEGSPGSNGLLQYEQCLS